MAIFTFILLIVLVVIIFDKLGSMKREIDAQRVIIFSLRDQILKLTQSMKNPVQNSEKEVEKVSPEIITEVEEGAVVQEEIEEMPLVEAAPEKRVALSMEENAVLMGASEFVAPADKEVAVATSDKEAERVSSAAFEREPEVESKPLIGFDEVKEREAKKPLFAFNSENWVGVNLLNRLGALLIVIGAIATAAFDGFPSWVRSLILFAFASSVIILGEVMNRKKTTTASIGVTAVGVALLYIAVAASYFVLGTLGMYAALVACVLATAIGIYLAIRYDEQVVACFALVGGYLPIFALDPFNDALTLGLVVYFVLLGAYSLSLALSKKWLVSNFIGLFLAIASTTYLGFRATPTIALLYACFAFLVYTVLPLVSTYKANQKFHEADVILVMINAFVSSIIIFLIAMRLDIAYIHTYLSVIFALIYLGLAQLIRRVYQHKSMETIFTLKAIAFCFLFVPFTFDYHWFAVAWLIEAVVLMSYGILRKQKFFEYSGLSILGIAILTFLMSNLLMNQQFTVDYTFFSVGALVILGMYMFMERQFAEVGQVFKWLALVNFWGFVMYLLRELIVHINGNIYTWAFYIVATLILAIVYVKVKLIADKGTFIIANVIHALLIPLAWAWYFEAVWLYFQGRITSFLGVLSLNFTLLLLAVGLVVYFKQKVMKNSWLTAYLNVWLINLLGVSLLLLTEMTGQISGLNWYFIWPICITLTLIVLVAYVKIKVLTSPSLHIIVNAIHGLNMMMLWVSTFIFGWFRGPGHVNAGGLLLNLFITIASIASVIYYQKSERNNLWVSIYKNMMLANGWLTLLVISARLMRDFEGWPLILMMMTFILAYVLKFLPVMYDNGTKIVATGMQMIGLVWLATFNLSIYESMFVLLSLNAAAQLIALFTLNELVKYLRNKEGQDTPFKVLILSGYFLLVVTQGIMVQGQIAFNSAIISVLFGVTALAWIVLGFYLKNIQVRKFGLYLAMLSAVKLLVVDTWGLSTPMRIGSYLTLGVVLMIISFVYQKFNLAEKDTKDE